MSYVAHTETYKGCTITIEQDEDAESPRKAWDNLGTLVHWHRRYDLGDRCIRGKMESWVRELADAVVPFSVERFSEDALWKIVHKHYLVLPVALLDHSGLHMWVGSQPHWSDSAGWDSGQVGWIYVSHARIRENWGVKRVNCLVPKHDDTKIKALDYAREMLESEVKTFDQYIRGQVWRFFIQDTSGEYVDSCGGYYQDTRVDSDDSEVLRDARSSVDAHVARHGETVTTEV